MIRPLVYWPDKRLISGTALDIAPAGTEAAQLLAKDLADSMLAWGGVGLAAPQIGERAAAFAISQELADDVVNWAGEGQPSVDSAWIFFKPEITWLSSETETNDEGCLSFPDIFLKIERHLQCVVFAKDVNGIGFTLRSKGLLARAIQHEYEHLCGQTMMDKFSRLKRELITKKMRKWKKRHGAG